MHFSSTFDLLIEQISFSSCQKAFFITPVTISPNRHLLSVLELTSKNLAFRHFTPEFRDFNFTQHNLIPGIVGLKDLFLNLIRGHQNGPATGYGLSLVGFKGQGDSFEPLMVI